MTFPVVSMKAWLGRVLLYLGMLGSIVFISACGIDEYKPVIRGISVAQLDIQGNDVIADIMFIIEGRAPRPLSITLNELKLYQDYNTVISELQSPQHYVLHQGMNKIIVPLSFKHSLIIEDAFSIIAQGNTIDISISGLVDYKYRKLHGKLRFSETVKLNMTMILKAILQKSF